MPNKSNYGKYFQKWKFIYVTEFKKHLILSVLPFGIVLVILQMSIL